MFILIQPEQFRPVLNKLLTHVELAKPSSRYIQQKTDFLQKRTHKRTLPSLVAHKPTASEHQNYQSSRIRTHSSIRSLVAAGKDVKWVLTVLAVGYIKTKP
jgi:hypothetical protein